MSVANLIAWGNEKELGCSIRRNELWYLPSSHSRIEDSEHSRRQASILVSTCRLGGANYANHLDSSLLLPTVGGAKQTIAQ